MAKDIRPVLRAGALAHVELYPYTIPCKVLSVCGTSGAPAGTNAATVRLTATRGPWKKGEIRNAWGCRVIPRGALKQRRMGARITYYTVEPDSGKEYAT
jgi:hypothetical protein